MIHRKLFHLCIILNFTLFLSSCLITKKNEENKIITNENSIKTEDIGEEYAIPPNFDFEGTLAKWFQFKQAASSVTLDDGTYDQYAAAFPILEDLGIKGTFYLAARLLDEGVWDDNGTIRKMMNWDQAAEIAEAGHEIGSHTYNHIDLTTGEADVEFELRFSREYIEKKIPSINVETFCWPHWRETEETLKLAAENYISARSGNGVISYYLNRKGGIPSNPPENMYRINALGILNSQRDDEWKSLIDSVYKKGSWFVSSYHGVDNGNLPRDCKGWSALSSDVFTQTLLYPKNLGFWMDTFANVSKYIFERDASVLHVRNTGKTIELILDDQLDDTIYNQKLSLNLKIPLFWLSPAVSDNSGREIPYKIDGNTIFLDIIPDGSIIEIKPY